MEAFPWWGEFRGRKVQLVKRILRKILGKQELNYEELLTFKIKVEGVINSHPLCQIYDTNVDNIITLSHLVFGRRLLTQIQGEIFKIQNILEHFWKKISERLFD